MISFNPIGFEDFIFALSFSRSLPLQFRRILFQARETREIHQKAIGVFHGQKS